MDNYDDSKVILGSVYSITFSIETTNYEYFLYGDKLLKRTMFDTDNYIKEWYYFSPEKLSEVDRIIGIKRLNE